MNLSPHRCGQCLNGTTCNAYTGHCVQCANSYLVSPYCQESYPYVAQPLKVLNNSYFSVQLEVNAQAQYVKGKMLLKGVSKASAYQF